MKPGDTLEFFIDTETLEEKLESARAMLRRCGDRTAIWTAEVDKLEQELQTFNESTQP